MWLFRLLQPLYQNFWVTHIKMLDVLGNAFFLCKLKPIFFLVFVATTCSRHVGITDCLDRGHWGFQQKPRRDAGFRLGNVGKDQSRCLNVSLGKAVLLWVWLAANGYHLDACIKNVQPTNGPWIGSFTLIGLSKTFRFWAYWPIWHSFPSIFTWTRLDWHVTTGWTSWQKARSWTCQ